jgi:hypothetical protein
VTDNRASRPSCPWRPSNLAHTSWLLRTFGDSGSLQQHGHERAAVGTLETPGEAMEQGGICSRSAGPASGIHQQCARAHHHGLQLRPPAHVLCTRAHSLNPGLAIGSRRLRCVVMSVQCCPMAWRWHPPRDRTTARGSARRARRGRSQPARRAGSRGDPATPAHTPRRRGGVGLQQHGPLAGDAVQDRGEVRTHSMPSWTRGLLIPLQTGEAWRLPTAARSQAIPPACCLTSCHARQSRHRLPLRGMRPTVSDRTNLARALPGPLRSTPSGAAHPGSPPLTTRQAAVRCGGAGPALSSAAAGRAPPSGASRSGRWHRARNRRRTCGPRWSRARRRRGRRPAAPRVHPV